METCAASSPAPIANPRIIWLRFTGFSYAPIAILTPASDPAYNNPSSNPEAPAWFWAANSTPSGPLGSTEAARRVLRPTVGAHLNSFDRTGSPANRGAAQLARV